MPPLAGQGQGPARLAVEYRPHGNQFVHPARPFVDQDPHGLCIAQAGSGGERVGQVEIGRVLVAPQHGSHAALGPTGGRLGQLRLGQYPHPKAVAAFGTPTRGGQRRGEAHRGRQAGHAAAQHQDVEWLRAGERRTHTGPSGSQLSIRRTPATVAAMSNRSDPVDGASSACSRVAASTSTA